MHRGRLSTNVSHKSPEFCSENQVDFVGEVLLVARNAGLFPCVQKHASCAISALLRVQPGLDGLKQTSKQLYHSRNDSNETFPFRRLPNRGIFGCTMPLFQSRECHIQIGRGHFWHSSKNCLWFLRQREQTTAGFGYHQITSARLICLSR